MDEMYVVTKYTPEVQQLIKSFKYQSNQKLVNVFIPHFLTLFQQYCQKNDSMIITGIPMFFLQKWKRGYNQSYLLAQELAKEINTPFYPILSKHRYTKHQAELARERRLINLKNSFSINKKFINTVV